MLLLFSLIFRSCVYPSAWGLALIRSLVKPGKSPDNVSNLRGIRLLCSLASWFGRVLDFCLRDAWEAGLGQFGFKAGVGCMEAVAVILALIYSRTCAGRRLFVVWIDLRTAFPSLHRAILVKRLFECGINLCLCRLVLTILDLTYSIPCIGKLLGKQFKEKLGVREGAVESPHLFNI